MGYQTSETHEKFRNEQDTIPHPEFTPNPQGFVLSNHHTDGPSKVKKIPKTGRLNLFVVLDTKT